jgi:error-prone DNA polymerase
MSEPYVPLWVKSNFSFLEGASHPQELVERAQELGLSAMALTDRDGVYGVVHAHMRGLETGVRVIIGSEVTVVRDSGDAAQVVFLAMDRDGYGNLCQLISQGRLRSEKGTSSVSVEEVHQYGEGLLALCSRSDWMTEFRERFSGRLYGTLQRNLLEDDSRMEQRMRKVCKDLGVPTVAANEVLYHTPARQPLHDVLACIREGKTLAEASGVIRPNAEFDLKPPHAMERLFEDDRLSLERTREVRDRAAFSLAELRYRYPSETRPDGTSEAEWLRHLSLEGARVRYPHGVADAVVEQIEKELSLIHELDYGGYFLTMYEIVQFCRKQGILCQGRGSAANSVVCFCLGITAVDPVKLDLLFERFISRERAEPPDIDLDIEHQRREEVIQWVYERYGRRHAAMVANIIRYRTRSAIRDVGKVLGLPMTALDRMSKLMGSRFVTFGEEVLTPAGLDKDAPRNQLFIQLTQEIVDFPRHLSIHPGGFLLGHVPVDTLVPIENATMADRTVIQWDKYSVEDLGLFKVDLLGLGALSHLHRCFQLLSEHYGIELDMARIPMDDPETFEMIGRGETVGVFQIESRAQMSMLPRLKPRVFYDLVIEVAIIRPGPIQGGMVHPYLRRRNGEESPEYPHPMLERVLGKTLGVPIFQEQVMKIAVLVGGYTPGEADQLRRDMAAWKSSGRIERHRLRLIQRMIEAGLTPEFAERIFSQIRGFGEYGFPESHAASFALIAYATAYLRCHHPVVFVCGLLNAQPMGFYSPATIVEDAKRLGVEILPVDLQHSVWDAELEKRNGSFSVRMGFRFVKGLGVREADALERAPGPYASLEDCLERTRLPLAAVLQLAEAGALESFYRSRRDALWAVRAFYGAPDWTLPLEGHRSNVVPRQPSLFAPLSKPEEVLWDYRTSAHSPRGHPMLQIRPELTRRGIPAADVLNGLPDGCKTTYMGLVICRQQPGTATGVTFYTLEDETGFVNVVVWLPVFRKHSVIGRTAVFLGVEGKVQSESGVVHLIADRLFEPEMALDGRGTTARSFC